MSAPLQGSSEWVAWRRGGIGASELPAIIGEDNFRSEYELALDKRGEGEPFTGNAATRWGHRLQRVALAVYAEQTGKRVRNVNTTRTSSTYPHVYASLDGRVVGERKGVEVKLTSRWIEPPRKVVVQCLTQMGVCDLDTVDVVRVGMYSEPVVFTIERDDDLIDELLGLGEAWYVRYVLGDELPPVDGSRGASRHLDKLEGGPDMVADHNQQALVLQLKALKATQAKAKADHDLVVNQLKASMVGSYGMRSESFRISWKPSKPRSTTDWQGVASELGQAIAAPVYAAAIEDNTTTKEGARPFRVTFEREGESHGGD